MIKCINCGNSRHIYRQCKVPITSNGIININEKGEYLMICRKKTLGYVDFVRGKYNLQSMEHLKNLIYEMTLQEKQMLLNHSFDELWTDLWNTPLDGGSEEFLSREKFILLQSGCSVQSEQVTLRQLIEECSSAWTEPEWGFPKGRRNQHESDYTCALREYEEETGYDKKDLTVLSNVLPYEEVFTGSNYKSYKHKYFVAFSDQSVQRRPFQENEVSDLKWVNYEEALQMIRPYNIERKRLVEMVQSALKDYIVIH
jgi:8-oxo-dGTP pyrophosphatase MutT (NUDIX family)